MEIKIGEYVRTKNGYIHKIVKEEFKDVYADTNGYWIHIKEMTKHSKNIIDIIEIGDIVNEHKVIGIGGNFVKLKYMKKLVPDFEIKTILTHELYEENCYKVVE